MNKEGFLNTKTKVLSKDFDASYFTQIDIREVKEIPTYKKKIKMMTNHPQQSYKISVGEDENVTIEILNQKEFWSVSKYLVVQVN